ncbi:hypothetical protein B816_513 [Weissella confusa]|nr:hypothetical protein [Weissella confusa]MDA5459025.1 hypothetical protein [Weissella confusa]
MRWFTELIKIMLIPLVANLSDLKSSNATFCGRQWKFVLL